MSERKLSFHPIAVVIGLVGALLLVGGILGATGSDLVPALTDPVVWISLLVLGALMTVAEVALVVLGVRSRS